MSRGAVLALAALACAYASTQASVLVPTYVLPPDTFVRDQRSLDDQRTADSQRTIRRLVGGHMRIDRDKSFGDPAKNSFTYDEKSESVKYAGAVAPGKTSAGVGWNQGVWDDGMLMSSAGEGKDAPKGKEDDEDKKTLSDQVAEGKYGLIQNEIFQNAPKRPGVISYDSNSDTRNKDNVHTLGGLNKDEIWLAEDHLLVLKGGSFPEHGHKSERKPWIAIDDYEAPRRQVKLPQKPLVPPPFPVRLSDDGPLVFLTPNGSVPAALFPPFPPGASDGSLPPASFPYPPGVDAAGEDSRNATSGGAPFPVPPFPYIPGNASEGGPFPPFLFPFSMNGSFPEGFPPGAAFLPPPSNQTDLYDEEDPSIYYPPPYNFSYRVENNGSVPPGPLVPGIVLPPPPDFFAPLEERTTTTEQSTTNVASKQKPTIKRPQNSGYVNRKPPKARPTTENTRNPIHVTTTPRPIVVVDGPKQRQPQRVVQIPRPSPVRTHNYAHEEPITKQNPIEKPTYKLRPKPTAKPASVPVYNYKEEQTYHDKVPTTSAKPYEPYVTPSETPNVNVNSIVTSTPVPLRAYYTNTQHDSYPKTELKPVYSSKQNENSLASFYFYDEQPKVTPAPAAYFDGRTYYKAVPIGQNHNNRFNPNTQTGFTPSVNVAYGSIDQSDNLLIWPQKQGPRTLTQEYFSIQKPKNQQVYVQNGRPDGFYHQIADIQQTIDFFTTNRPNQYITRPNSAYKQKPATVRPVYQFSYQSKPRPEQITFRAPKLDTEPFRPMVSYSKPYNIDPEYNTIPPSPSPVYHQQYLVENVKVTTETPTSSKYYPKGKPKDEDYEDTPVKYENERKNAYAKPKAPQRVQIIKSVEQFPSTTPNSLSHGYYTKQDERYVDDITKNYFEHFGKKIEDTHDVNGIAVTPPLQTVRTPINNGINLQYANDDSDSYRPNPPSLAGDTLVNFRRPRPYVEPESEFIPIPNPAYQQYEQIQRQILREQQAQQVHQQAQQQVHQQQAPRPPPTLPPYTAEQLDLFRPAPPPNLASDIAVNYNRPLPPVNPNAELIDPINSAGEGRPGSFVSYRLPGEGAHVYFLTPQAARERYGYRPRGSGR